MRSKVAMVYAKETFLGKWYYNKKISLISLIYASLNGHSNYQYMKSTIYTLFSYLLSGFREKTSLAWTSKFRVLDFSELSSNLPLNYQLKKKVWWPYESMNKNLEKMLLVFFKNDTFKCFRALIYRLSTVTNKKGLWIGISVTIFYRYQI